MRSPLLYSLATYPMVLTLASFQFRARATTYTKREMIAGIKDQRTASCNNRSRSGLTGETAVS